MTVSTMLSLLSEGFVTSLLIFVLTLLFSMPLGLAVMFGRRSRLTPLRGFIKAYISIMRGTPLMLQLMVVYYGPYYIFKVPITLEYQFYAVIIAFAVNYAAYFAEIYRSGIESMPVGQYEAAKVLGYKDYSELSYVRMNRIGYGQAEIQAFRDQVARDVVPELQKVMAMRAKRTGITHPTFTDLPIIFKDGNPKPIPGYQARMDAARTMYHELSPETAEFIDFMQDNELFDVESRPGKMSGGYMTSLPSYKAPFIFANWNDTSGDVDVLTHECGHAFEGYVAERDPNVPADLECPAMESAEIHSMAMEFLTAPWHHLLFGKDTEKYALLHAEDSFVFLAYGCAVDEFQHIMYQNPDLTPDQRNAEWLKLEKKYRPWIDFDNLPFYGRGAGWQRQLHIYECPFYYIDYCLSTMAALQFFLLSLTDHKDAWERYLKLVRRAGLASYTELLETAGLKVPFEDGSIKGIAQQMTDWLEAHQV